jgi:hypothetical protein
MKKQIKTITWIIILVLLTTLVSGIKECAKSVEPTDIPCQVTSTWNYTAPCTNHKALVYNQSGKNINNFTYSAYGGGLCKFAWNITTLGSYSYIVTNGDTGNITIEDKNMIMNIIIGVGIICALLFWLAWQLDDEHTILKVILFITAISTLMIIPAALTSANVTNLLHKSYMLFYRIFWIYVFIFISYKTLQKLGLVATKVKVE